MFNNNLENENFQLTQLMQDHFDELYDLAKNPAIWEQHPEKDRWKKEKFEIYFQNALKNKEGCFCIYDKTTEKFIGSSRYYSYNENMNSVKIGYTFITPEYWGSSANFEIKKIMLDYIFQYVSKVFFDIGKENYRSQKSVEKLGAQKQNEENNNNLLFLLSKENWQQTKSTRK